MKKPLFKTTVIIWSENDPTSKYELEELASEAVNGAMYCSSVSSSKVEDPTIDSDWDGTEFFFDPNENEDELPST